MGNKAINQYLKHTPRLKLIEFFFFPSMSFSEGLSSACNIGDSKLVLFLPKERQSALKTALDQELRADDDVFKTQFEIRLLEKSIEIAEETGTKEFRPGCQICYYTGDDKLRYATCGAFVKDEEGKLYILSSCHGHTPDKVYLQSSTSPTKQRRHKLKLAHEVHQKDPLLDAVLLEVSDSKLVDQCDPHMCRPHKNSALCGMYTGHTEDIAHVDEDWQKGEPPVVMKYGGTSKLTKGRLTLFHYQNPNEYITNALVITPSDSKELFSMEGDSGSVIFREDTHRHPDKYPSFSLHEGLAMQCYTVKGLEPNVTCSLAFRLDDAVEYFEGQTGKHLEIQPFNH